MNLYNSNDWKHIQLFADEQGIHVSNIYMRLANTPLLKNTMVNVKKLEKRREFHSKVWNKSHDNYFKITEHISDTDLAKLLTRYSGGNLRSWQTYISQNLFSTGFKYRSLLSYKISDNLWAFFRITTFLIRRIERKW